MFVVCVCVCGVCVWCECVCVTYLAVNCKDSMSLTA